jgi:hypothetical protein
MTENVKVWYVGEIVILMQMHNERGVALKQSRFLQVLRRLTA